MWISMGERRPFRTLNWRDLSFRRKQPDECSEEKLSPDAKRHHFTQESDLVLSPDVCHLPVDRLDSRKVVFTIGPPEGDDEDELQQEKESAKEKWRRIARLALVSERQNKSSNATCRIISDQDSDIDLTLCSTDQLNMVIRYCFGRCPPGTSCEEKIRSVRRLWDNRYKKDSRVWLHKSSRRAARLRREREHPEVDWSSTYVSPHPAMSLENFRKLLMVHRGARTRNTPDTGNQTVSLETNTSSFDRINLGPFYEEHQRQRKLLLVDSREPVNRTVSPNRRQQQQQQQQGGRRLQRVDAELRREMCSLPDVAVKDATERKQKLKSGDVPFGYVIANSSSGDLLDDDFGRLKMRRSFSDSMLDRARSSENKRMVRDDLAAKEKVVCPDFPEVDRRSNCSCPGCCLKPEQHYPMNTMGRAQMENGMSWEEVDRNTMARYNHTAAIPVQLGNTLSLDNYSVASDAGDVQNAHSLSPNSDDDKMHGYY